MAQKQIKELRENFKNWSKGHYKKKDTWVKEDNTSYKKYGKQDMKQRYGKPQKKESYRNPGNKKSL
jgi:hypothetical protein